MNFKLKEIFTNKKINIVIVVLLLFFISLGIYIRIQNLHLLKDTTTGQYIPLALDPFYFLRMEKTIEEKGFLPEVDVMRYPSMNVSFSKEKWPFMVIAMHKISNFFGSFSLEFIHVIYPIVFFALTILVYFFLLKKLTNKYIALIASIFLTVIPTFLYRTMAGFSDHEAVGMFALFLSFLLFAHSFNSEKKQGMIFSCIAGILTAFVVVSWGGVFRFATLIPSLAILFLFFTNSLNKKQKLFFFLWVIFLVVFLLIFTNSFSYIKDPLFSITLFSIALIIVDFGLEKKFEKKFEKIKMKIPRQVLSLILLLILALIVLLLYNPAKIVEFANGMLIRLLYPFGRGRIASTVAENAPPFLKNWISNLGSARLPFLNMKSGKIFFFLFLLGTLFFGFELTKRLNKKSRYLFIFSYIVLILLIIFSRISPQSLLNGENFISKMVYFVGLIQFVVILFYLIFKDNLNFSFNSVFVFSWTMLMIIAARGAIRLFFVITPTVTLMASYFIFLSYRWSKGIFLEKKEEVNKIKEVGKEERYLLKALFFIVLILALFILYTFTTSSLTQAKYTAPSANEQWQYAMKWVRENTPKEAIFVHWWDYGYWIQWLGERRTVTDGGHANGYWDHLIGRYVLTTPQEKTALLFMKAHNVSYLLLDPTDIGKYGAYSSIGSDKGGEDRKSYIPSFILDETKTLETRNSTKYYYLGGFVLDEDIVYKDMLFPKGKAGIGAIVLNMNQAKEISAEAILIYKGQQFNLPLRCLAFSGTKITKEDGIDFCVYFFPYIDNGKLNNLGAAFLLSNKTKKSLFARLYIFNESIDGFELVHEGYDFILKSIRRQINDDFVIYRGAGFRGPIKIYRISYPAWVSDYDYKQFRKIKGEYADLDYFYD